MHPCLDLLSYYIGLHIRFCVSAILFYYYGSEINLAIWKGNPSRIILFAYNYFSYF